MAERDEDARPLRWACVLAVGALFAANLHKLLDPWWLPIHDSLFHLTKFLYVYAAMGAHELPLWDSYLYGGAQPFYLLLNNALALDPVLWIVGGIGSALGAAPKDVFVLVTLAGIVVFALGGALLARELFGDSFAPAVTFIALLFCGEATYWSQQVYDFAVIEYVPWVLAFLVRYWRRPEPGRFLALVASLGICASVYYPAYLIVFALTAGVLIALLRRGWLAPVWHRRILRHALLASPVAVLLILPLAIEYAEILTHHSQVGRPSQVDQATALDIPELIVTHGFWRGLVPGMFHIGWGAYREMIPVVGMPVFFFMLVSLRRGRAAALGFLILGVMALHYLGVRPVVSWSARLIPFYRIIRTFGFFSGFITLMAVLLACLGMAATLERARRTPRPALREWWWETACLLACAALALAFQPGQDGVVSLCLIAMLALTILGRAPALRPLQERRVALWALCVLGAGAYNVTVANELIFANDRGKLFSYERGFGFSFERPSDYTWRHPRPSGLMPYNNVLCCMTSYHLAERRDGPWFYAELGLLGTLGHDTVLRHQPYFWVKHHTTFLSRDYERLARVPGFPDLMRWQVHLMRHYDVLGLDAITDFGPLLRASTVALESDAEVRRRGARRQVGPGSAEEPPLAAERLALLYKTANTVGFEVQLPEPGFFVYTDMYHPGFRVRVDGRPAPLLKAMGAFKAVELEAGTHRIEFAFLPRFRYALAAYLLITIPLTLAAVAYSVRMLTGAARPATEPPRFGA